MATRITLNSTVDLANSILPGNSKYLESFKDLVSFHSRTAGLAFAEGSDNSTLVLAELHKSVSNGDALNDVSMQDELAAATSNAYELFAVNLYTNSLNCLLKGISQKIAGACEYHQEGEDGDQKKSAEVNAVAGRVVEEVGNVELQYALGTEPKDFVKSFHSEVALLFRSLLGKRNLQWSEAHAVRKDVSEASLGEFNAWLSSDIRSAEQVKAYLNFSQQVQQQGRILEEVKGIRQALSSWISPAVELTGRKSKAWGEYRSYLKNLPDEKVTMFDEDFGVRKVFVQPEAEYSVAGNRRKHVSHVYDVAAMIGTLVSNRTAGEDLTLLCGGPGSGKSTLCRFLASELAESPEVYPVFLRLRRMEDSKEIIPFLEEYLQRIGVIDKISELSALPNLVLILDGFDELVMASRTRLREFFSALREDVSSGPLRKAKVIVSGRDTLFPNGSGLPNGAHVVSLLPFDGPRIKAWGKRWRSLHKSGRGKTFRPEKFVSSQDGDFRGSQTAPLEHLVSWPLTLHLVARAHTSGSISLDAKKSDQIAKAVLYRSIVADSALRQTEQNPGEGRLDEKQMRRFVRAIAWEMYRQGKEALELSEGLPILQRIFPNASESTLAELSDVTIVNQPELTKGDETGFEFVHKSFSEYFVAEKIAESIEISCFKVAEYGGGSSWRMTVNEATTEMAEHFSVRLFTAEVQEMLEPMLGDLSVFLKNDALKEDTNPAVLAENLERKLERMQQLLIEFSKGKTLKMVNSGHGDTPRQLNDLELYANFVSGLFLVSGSICKSLKNLKKEASRSLVLQVRIFLRLVHIVLAGDISFEKAFADRIFYSVEIEKFDDATEYLFPPLQPAYLSRIKGLPDQLSEAIAEMDLELVCSKIWASLEHTLPMSARKRGRMVHERERFSDRFFYDDLDRWRSEGRDYLGRVLQSEAISGTPRDWRYLQRELHEASEYFARASSDEERSDSAERMFLEIRRWLHHNQDHISGDLLRRIERMFYERLRVLRNI